METCETCKFWTKVNESTGFCFRYPPTVHVHLLPAGPARNVIGPNNQGMALKPVETVTWPRIDKDKYCGEWNG